MYSGVVQVTQGRSGSSHWELATRPVPLDLSPYIHHITGYLEQAAHTVSQRQFPEPRLVMIIELGPPLRLTDPGHDGARFKSGFVAGLGLFPTVTEHDGHQRGVEVGLTLLGARALFQCPLDALAGRTVSLPDLLPRGHQRLKEQLQELTSHEARFNLVEQIIRARLATDRTDHTLMQWTCTQIERSGGNINLRALARTLGYSPRHMVRLVRAHCGLAPKQYARLVRFDCLRQRLTHGPRAGFAELAAELGYHDQAHLGREVRELAGVTPTQLKASGFVLWDAAG